ncbi:hypothetical protein K438DRAFT_1781579 [Mycena galopus ATCC 62051]|nr:hypothetical protein K438DRAFT_1781579 [Mycena galopus ATCC 62051]
MINNDETNNEMGHPLNAGALYRHIASHEIDGLPIVGYKRREEKEGSWTVHGKLQAAGIQSDEMQCNTIQPSAGLCLAYELSGTEEQKMIGPEVISSNVVWKRNSSDGESAARRAPQPPAVHIPKVPSAHYADKFKSSKRRKTASTHSSSQSPPCPPGPLPVPSTSHFHRNANRGKLLAHLRPAHFALPPGPRIQTGVSANDPTSSDGNSETHPEFVKHDTVLHTERKQRVVERGGFLERKGMMKWQLDEFIELEVGDVNSGSEEQNLSPYKDNIVTTMGIEPMTAAKITWHHYSRAVSSWATQTGFYYTPN